MPAGDYLEGLLFAGLTFALVVAGAVMLARRRLGQYEGAERVVVIGLIATLGLLATHLLPAIFGLLGREAVFVTAILWFGALVALPAIQRSPSPPPPPHAVEGRAPRIIAAVSGGLLVLFALAVARELVLLAPMRLDALNFHLPGVARWIETGSIWQIDVFLADLSQGHYPNSGDVALLAAILPWKNDFLVHYAMYPFWALTGVAVYALARQVRCARELALAAACLVLAVPAVSVAALEGGLVDAMTLFGFSAGLLFCVRHHRTADSADLVLAGLAFGVALGAKWYGLSSVAVVIVVWALARLRAGERGRVVLGQAGAVTGLALAAGGIWLLRNLVESGNPFFPVKVAPFGVTIFDAPPDVFRELGGFTVLHYLTDPEVWIDWILPQLRDGLALPALIAIVGVLVAVILVRRGAGAGSIPDRGLIVAGSVITLLLVGVYVITPYSAGGLEGEPSLVAANARYAVTALIPAVVIAAWAVGRLRRGPILFTTAALVGVLDGIWIATRGDLARVDPGLRAWAFAVLAAAAIVVLILAARYAWGRFASAGEPGRRLAIAAAAAAGVIAVVGAIGAGYEIQQRYNAKRYVGADAATDPLVTSPTPARVGLAAVWDNTYSPAYPAFGPRLANDVEYVGRFSEDVYRRFSSQEEFETALRSGDFDFLVVGLGPPGAEDPPELRWARAAGFRDTAASDRLVLLEPARSDD